MQKVTSEKTRDELISQLVVKLPQTTKTINITMEVAIWLLSAWAFVVALILFNGGLRPNVGQQLLSNWRFTLESIVGFIGVLLAAVLALRLSIPAAARKSLVLLASAVVLLWLFNFVLGLFWPTMDVSMLGKREHCVWETFFYSLPPLVLGIVLINRGFVLNGRAAGLAMGLAAGFIPAWLMQLACMYEAKHILLMHIGPAVVVGGLGFFLGWLMQRNDSLR